MKVEQYLDATSRAIERAEEALDAAHAAYAELLRRYEPSDTQATIAIDAAFTAEVSRAFLTMLDTLSNLRKWPRT